MAGKYCLLTIGTKIVVRILTIRNYWVILGEAQRYIWKIEILSDFVRLNSICISKIE
jgi:hypothetical protein